MNRRDSEVKKASETKSSVQDKASCKHFYGFNLVDLLTIIIGAAFYIFVARYWQPFYIVKSAAKAVAFVGLPLAATWYFYHNTGWLKLRMEAGRARKVFGRIALTSVLIIAVFILISKPVGVFFRVNQIMNEVKGRTSVAKPLIAASAFYIAIVNSMIEEIFFRGYILQRLKVRIGFNVATIISAVLFALYHLITFRSWFNTPLLILTLSALMLAGLILNYITERYNSLLPAWMLHGLMNLAIFAIALPYF